MFFNSLFHNFLKVLPIFLFFIFITPVILVLSSLFNGYSDNWFHLYNLSLFTSKPTNNNTKMIVDIFWCLIYKNKYIIYGTGNFSF